MTNLITENLLSLLGRMSQIDDNARFWGQYIDGFFALFPTLSKEQMELLRLETSKRLRSNLMRNYLLHIQHNADCGSKKELEKMVQNGMLLIIFENYEYDSRETTLYAIDFVEFAREILAPTKVEAIWDTISHKASEKTVLHFEHTLKMSSDC